MHRSSPWVKGFHHSGVYKHQDKDRIFEGGPYFFVAAGLYMRPWVMNFVSESETFTSVPVWVRIFSLPLDYWQNESLVAIGNKLGHFIKASEATRRGKYTSYARICVEMDLSGALPDEVILEVFDEEWVQTMDYEHIPFRCRKCHEHGHLIRDCPLSKEEDKIKLKAKKDIENFHKVSSRGKGSKKEPTQQHKEGQKASQNKFQALVELEYMLYENQSMEKDPKEKEKEENNTPAQNINEEEDTMMSEAELEMD